jgi:site-specific DNA-methyltransferase (adenine-specific)
MKLEIIYKKINEIIPYKNNPRKNDDAVEDVANSIKEFGFKVPIVIDKNNEIVAGHTRYKASKKLGLEEVPCIIADDLSEEQIKAFRLADNKVSEKAEWDLDLLNEELGNFETIDMTDFGFDIDLDLNDEQEIIEDEVPEAPEDPKTKLGDIYQLGNHRLMCGDSTSEEDVAKLMNGVKADMVFTDPPYGMNLDTDFSGMKSKIFKGGNGGNFYEEGIVDTFTPDMLKTIFDLDIKETFIWGANYFAELLPNRNNGSWIVWDKRANGNDNAEEDYSSDKMYGSCFELCWSKNKHKQDIARIKWAGMFGMEKQDTHTRVHPTQKPIALCEWFIKRYSNDGNAILDLFGGSGSTLIACEQLNRNCYMMELDPHYIDVIIQRWENFTGEKAVKIN